MLLDDPTFLTRAQALCDAGRLLSARGACPATSSNFSARLSADSLAITISGRDKGALTPADIMVVDLAGAPRSEGKPSAETLLHSRLYARKPALGAVLHTHSIWPTLFSQLTPEGDVVLEGWELLKAFEGVITHEARLTVPVFDNTQDISALADRVDAWLAAHPKEPCFGYLIRGHGIYVWGDTMAACLRHLEAFEYLFHIELERRRFERVKP
jgi:methylthioribulose-1-phosphate dehydratase